MVCATLVVEVSSMHWRLQFDGLGTVFLEICRYTESGLKIIKHRFVSFKIKLVLDF